ncbi:MAG: hypothetical protein KAS23_13885 [Anaerohalosphaera sp.]|nr:hypothetical protein [Anaerohalosphaera sp.]
MNIKKLILRQKVETDKQTQGRILAGAFSELDNIAKTYQHGQPFKFFKSLLNSRAAQLASVASIIAAIFITVHYVDTPIGTCSVAMAQVSEKINNVKSLTYCCRQRILDGCSDRADKTETVLYISPDHGVRLGTYVDGKTEMQTFLLPAENVKITVMTEEKQYMRDELTEQDYGQIQREKDPRELIRQFLSSDYKDLGSAVVCGIQSHGIEVSNPGFLQNSMKDVVGRLWINVKTKLPVRMELEGTDIVSSNRVKIVTDEFRWDVGLQEDDFGPFIPDDYVLDEGNGKESR